MYIVHVYFSEIFKSLLSLLTKDYLLARAFLAL